MMANHDYQNMLARFRAYDLQTLLQAFGQSITGRKSELKDQAVNLLRATPPGFNQAEYLLKIREIYCSLPVYMYNNNAVMNHSLFQTQQRQMGQVQASQQRMYKPDPQYPQQSQLMSRIQRGIYGNSVGANTMANNNIQYISGSYQPSGPRSITSTHLSSNQQMNVALRNPLEYDMQGMTVGNNSYTPSPETVAQIKFKKLPFYELIDVVLKPTFLAGTDRCTLQNFPKGMQESQFRLFVPVENVNLVAMNRDVSSGKNEYIYQFQIRISQLAEPMSNVVTDFMPLGLNIRFGEEACPLPPTVPKRPGAESRRSPRPINCTEVVKLSPITPNMIYINWIPDNKKYVMAMYLVKKLTPETLIQRLQDKGGRSSNDTKNDIIKKFADFDPDLATTSYRFSLVCPLGKIRMKIPGKSIHCDHLQCFDVITFILVNEKRPTWICPICHKTCLYDDIQIENYFLDVVSSQTLKDSNKEIELSADGTWTIYEEKKETKSTNGSSDAKLKPIDFVNLDSDEEQSDKIKVELKLEKENENLHFVDLTLSDDEEKPTKQKYEQGNEAQAADEVQPQQDVTSSEQREVMK